MRRLVLATLLLALLPAAAEAHPLGNFSINHVAYVRVSADRIDVRYLLDQAEIPTFQERGRPASAILAAKRAEALHGLRLLVDGRRVALAAIGDGRIAYRPGQGGLPTTRVELQLRAPVAEVPRSVTLTDSTFADRVGWRDIVVAAGHGTAVRASAPASDPTLGLTRYPQSLLERPADRRAARFTVEPGAGTVLAPRRDGSGLGASRRGDSGFAGLFADAAAGRGVLLLLLLAAFGWGALHALSPGHGKAMVAAYLVGTRGTPRDALVLGATVTVTHTIGVFALGIVALSLSAYVLPETLYPWLNLVAGLMVVAVGLAVLRARARERGHHAHDHPHDHQHEHHDHGHRHHHHDARRLTPRGLLALGASAGLIPCPSALVVLLAAIAQHQIALGLLLIVAFSLGLATTLTGLGLAVVWTSGLATRLPRSTRVATAANALPVASALVVVAVGVLLAAHAVPSLV